MKKILITGGSGFLGQALALKLKNKYKVYLGSRNNINNFNASENTKCEALPMDITNINSIHDVLNYCNPEIVIHAAATKFVDLSENHPFECIDVNILGSTNLVRACIDKKIKKVIGVSTDKAAQPNKNLYGLSKATMERVFLNADSISDTNFICVRFGNIAWSTGSVLPIWKKMHEKNKIILTTGPYMRRFFFTAEQAADLVIYGMNNIKKFHGSIISRDMKSAKIIDILNVWIKKRGGSYKIIKQRKGDGQDENLIGENELDYTKKIRNKKIIYYVINYKKKIKRQIKKIISSKNSKKLSVKEIEAILDYKILSK